MIILEEILKEQIFYIIQNSYNFIRSPEETTEKIMNLLKESK